MKVWIRFLLDNDGNDQFGIGIDRRYASKDLAGWLDDVYEYDFEKGGEFKDLADAGRWDEAIDLLDSIDGWGRGFDGWFEVAGPDTEEKLDADSE